MTERVGILVEIDDKATSVLKGIGAAGKTSLETIRTAGDKAGAALKAVGMAATFLNQALELARKGVEIFRMLILDNITAMIEYRGEADATSKKFAKMADDAAYLRAIIADLLTPAILGLSDAYNETGSAVVDYINTNRRLMAANVISFLADVARVLISGVAKGLSIGSMAVSGLIEVWHLLNAAISAWVSVSLSGFEAVLRALAKLSEWAGKGELAASLTDAADISRHMAEGFMDDAGKSVDAMNDQIAAQKEFEQTIEDTKSTLLGFVDKAEGKMLKWASSWESIKRHVDEVTNAIVDQGDEFGASGDAAQEYYAMINRLGAKEAEHFKTVEDERMALVVQNANIIASSISQIGAAWTAVAITSMAEYDTMEEKSQAVNAAVISAVIDSAIITINAAAAMAAAKAFATNQSFPIIGVALGLAAAASAAAIAKGYLAMVPTGAQRGFRPKGGIPGVDSIPTYMQEGEVALDRRQTDLIDRLVRTQEKAPSAGGATMIINYTRQTMTPDVSAGHKRTIRDLNRALALTPSQALARA